MKAEALRLEGELTASKSRLEDMGALNDKLTAEKMQLIADTTRLSNDLKAVSYTHLAPQGKRDPGHETNNRKTKYAIMKKLISFSALCLTIVLSVQSVSAQGTTTPVSYTHLFRIDSSGRVRY